MNTPRRLAAAPSSRPEDVGPVSVQAAQPSRGHVLQAPPSGVRATGPALVFCRVTSASAVPRARRHVATDCDYCLTGERHPSGMF